MGNQNSKINQPNQIPPDTDQFLSEFKIYTPPNNNINPNIDHHQIPVGTPKQLPLDFPTNYLKRLPDFQLQEKSQVQQDLFNQKNYLQIIKNKIFNELPKKLMQDIVQLAERVQFKKELLDHQQDYGHKTLRIILRCHINLFSDLSRTNQRKILLRNLLNDFSGQAIDNLIDRLEGYSSIHVLRFLHICNTCTPRDINAARLILRGGIYSKMNPLWIQGKAANARFIKYTNELRFLYEKYLINFKLELDQGEVSNQVCRTKVLGMPSLTEKKDF